MTRRDFELIARTIRDYDGWPHLDDDQRMLQRVKTDLAFDFARALKQNNPRFDGAAFIKACGVDPTILKENQTP